MDIISFYFIYICYYETETYKIIMKNILLPLIRYMYEQGVTPRTRSPISSQATHFKHIVALPPLVLKKNSF